MPKTEKISISNISALKAGWVCRWTCLVLICYDFAAFEDAVLCFLKDILFGGLSSSGQKDEIC